MTPHVRHPLLALLMLTTPLAACAQQADAPAPVASAVPAVAQSTAPQLVTGLPDFTQLVEQVGPGVVNVEATVGSRRSATRSQQAARSAQRVARADVPARANGTAQGAPRGVDATTLVASAPVPAASSNPFSHRPQETGVVASRPWPRSALSAYPSASGSLVTGYSADSAARTFYPFEPRLPSSAPIAAPVDAPRD